MQKDKIIKGRVLHVVGNNIYIAQGSKIFLSQDGGNNWQVWVHLPLSFWQRLAMGIPILSRLFRLGIHHLGFVRNKAVVIANKESFLVEDNKARLIGALYGSRPLSLCTAENNVFYGEYRSNPKRSAVHIYKLDFNSLSWQPVQRFSNVRHIHGVYYDHHEKSFWVTTGDSNEESSIFRSDDSFNTLYKVAGGAQKYRAVQLLFTPHYVFFGSDAPDESNWIYRMNKKDYSTEALVSVGSSVFFGCCVDSYLFFSTAAEPSNVNNTKSVEVWCSKDNGENWKKILQLKKDFLSMKYFQYGQVFFPSLINGPSTILFCTPFAVTHHGHTFCIDIETKLRNEALPQNNPY